MSWASDAWDSAKDTAVTWSTGGLNKVYEAGKEGLTPDYNDDQFASKTRARLAREQWEDYKKRFQPYEDELAAQAYVGPEGEWMEGTPASVKMEAGDMGDVDTSSPLSAGLGIAESLSEGDTPGPEGGMVGQATRQAESQFDTGLDVASRQRNRYGMEAPGDSRQRQDELARGLAVAGNRNRAREAWDKQRMGLLTGSGGR